MQIPHSTRIPLKVKFDNLQIVVDQVNTCGCYRHFKLLLKLFLVSCLEKQDKSMAEGYHEQRSVGAGSRVSSIQDHFVDSPCFRFPRLATSSFTSRRCSVSPTWTLSLIVFVILEIASLAICNNETPWIRTIWKLTKPKQHLIKWKVYSPLSSENGNFSISRWYPFHLSSLGWLLCLLWVYLNSLKS